MQLSLSNPFIWDGTSNIVVAIDENTPNGNLSPTWRGHGCNFWAKDIPNGGNRCMVSYALSDIDPTNPAPVSYSDNRIPTIQFDLSGAPPVCSGTPDTPGVAFASRTAMSCPGTTTLFVKHTTAAMGIGYQWESSPDNISYTAMSGATTSIYATTVSATTYYRCVVSCAGSGLSATSNPVMVTVTGNALDTITPTLKSICANNSTVLTLQHYTDYATVLWQTSTDGINFVTIGGGNVPMAVSPSVDHYYRCVGTCASGGAVVTSPATLITVDTYQCYCASSPNDEFLYEDGDDIDIYSFTINGTNSKTWAGQLIGDAGSVWSKYQNWRQSGVLSTLPVFSQPSFTIEISNIDRTAAYLAYGGSNYQGQVRADIWIDFDQDGAFNNGTEHVYGQDLAMSQSFNLSGTFNMPLTLTGGVTGMRVRIAGQSGNYVSSCGLFGEIGETEDYLVNIQVPPSCSGTPNPGNTQASEDTVICAQAVTFSYQNIQTTGTNTSFQWQSSTNGVSFSNIAGANSYNFTDTVSFSKYYRIRLGCGNDSGFSTPAFVYVTSPPTLTTAASPTVVNCPGQAVGLSIQQNLAGMGFTFQWQSSADSINFTNISGATGNSYTATVASNTFYRVAVTCSAAGTTYLSIPVGVKVIGPQAGTVGVNPGNDIVCSWESFYLYASPASMSIYNYQWQRSTDNGLNWTVFPGGSFSTTTSQSVNTIYRTRLECVSNPTLFTYSVPRLITMDTFYSCYCRPPAPIGGVRMYQFKFGGLKDTTLPVNAPPDGYIQRTAYTSSYSRGGRYRIAATLSQAANASWFIDYNRDGVFSPTEVVQFITNLSTGEAIVTIPETAALGLTGLRIRTRFGNSALMNDPCASYDITYDYLINIVEADAQASNLVVTDATSSSLKLSFTRGTGSGGAIVLAREASPIATDPLNNKTYVAPSASTVYWSNPNNNSSWQVPSGTVDSAPIVYRINGQGNGSQVKTFTLKYLKPATRYYFSVYEFDSSAGGIVYMTAPDVMIDTLTPLGPPLAAASGVNITNVGYNSFTVNWTNGSGNGRLVLVKANTAVNATPANDSFYNTSSIYGLGSLLGIGNYAVYNGSGSSVQVTGLQSDVTYYVSVFERASLGTQVRYVTKAAKTSARTKQDYISLHTAGAAYTEDFDDSLSTPRINLPVGWHASGTYVTDDGSSSSTGIKNYGGSGSTDRALGSLGEGQLGARFINATGLTLTSLLVQYVGEQWRKGSGADTLKFQYSVNAQNFADPAASWTNVTALNFRSLVNTSPAVALDGNAAANRKRFRASITGLSIAPGAQVWIRFADVPVANNKGMAADDFMLIPFSQTVTASASSGSSTVYNDLNVTGGDFTLDNNLTIKNGLNIDSLRKLKLNGRRLLVRDQIYGVGTLSGSKTSSLDIGGAYLNQTIRMTSGADTLYTLDVMPAASATLATTLKIAATPVAGSVTVGSVNSAVSSDFNTGGLLTLLSDSTGTAMIGKVQGTVSGNVTVQRYLYADSGSRWISHPFNNALSPDALADDITVNYASGSGNVHYFDQATALTTGNAADISSSAGQITSAGFAWQPGMAIRFGKPAGTAIADYTGTVNTGPYSIPLIKGPGTEFVVIGNPYPAAVKMGTAMADAVASGYVSNVLYQWNPQVGISGAFVTIPASKVSTAKMVVGGSMVVVMTAPSGTLDFTELDKTTTGDISKFMRPGTYFDCDDSGATELPEGLKLSIGKGGRLFDELYLRFADAAENGRERYDALKLKNPAFNFYALSQDLMRLAVDTRPFTDGGRIPLGVAGGLTGRFVLKVSEYNLAAGKHLYILDNYLGTEQLLVSGNKYPFEIDGKPESQEGRFWLRMGSAGNIAAPDVEVSIVPNPAREAAVATVQVAEPTTIQLRLLSLTGAELVKLQSETTRQQRFHIPVGGLSGGVYLIEITTAAGQKTVRRLFKQ